MLIEFIESHLQSPKGNDFLDCVTNQGLFVDKSIFIKEIIDSKEQAILITRPPKWGKSLNLSMLNYFFRIELDKEKKSQNRVLFEGGEFELIAKKTKPKTIELNKLNITRDKEWSSKYFTHLGKYPVIYMNWSNIFAKTFDEFVKEFQRRLRELFSGYSEVSLYLRNESKDELNENYKAFKNSGKDLKECLSFLLELLHKIHQQKVIVLIDDYDFLEREMFENKFYSFDPLNMIKRERERKKVVNFISEMIKSVYDKNDKLEKIIIVGIMDILPKEKGSGADFLKTYGVLDEEFSESFGFSEHEINRLLNQIVSPQAYSVKNLIIKNLNEWYKGYTRPPLFEKELFNSSTVIWYLWECYHKKKVVDFKYFYHQKLGQTTKKIINKIISVDETMIETLLQLNEKTPTKLAINENFNFGNEYFWGIYEIHWSRLLLNLGCLTGKVEQNEFYALVPNREMASIIKDPTEAEKRDKEKKFHPNIYICHREKLKNQMKEYLKKDRKCFIGEENKSMFMDIFTGRYLVSQGDKSHKIYVGFESGFGFIDTLFEPIMKKSDSIIIHEYRFSKDNNKNPSNELNVLWSVYENNYLEQPLLIAANNPWIESIIIRPIIIYAPDTPEALELEIENVYHTVKEARKISEFFNKEETRNILNIKNVDREFCHEELLKKFQIKGNILELLEHILEEGAPKLLPFQFGDHHFDPTSENAFEKL